LGLLFREGHSPCLMDHILFSADYSSNHVSDEGNPNSFLASMKFLNLYHR